MARAYLKLSGIRSPDGEGRSEAFFEKGVIDRATKGPGTLYHNMHLMEAVLRDPAEIRKGIRDDGSGYAYIGRPETSYNKEGENRPAPKGLDFMVFMTSDRFVYDWRWDRRKDPEERFWGERTWPKS